MNWIEGQEYRGGKLCQFLASFIAQMGATKIKQHKRACKHLLKSWQIEIFTLSFQLHYWGIKEDVGC